MTPTEIAGLIAIGISISAALLAGLLWVIRAVIAMQKEFKPNGGSSTRDTLNEIRKQPQFALINLFNAERIQFYTRISTFNTFGKGWMSRVSGNLKYAADDMR